MNVDQSVTRLEIAETLSSAFEKRSVTREAIVAAAESTSRSEVVAVLRRLPDRRYSRLNELWEELHGIPVGA